MESGLSWSLTLGFHGNLDHIKKGFPVVLCRVQKVSLKDAEALFLPSDVSLHNQRRPPDMCPLSLSTGCLLLCFLLCFRAALPRILDYWVRYKLGSATACKMHLAASPLWHFLCV